MLSNNILYPRERKMRCYSWNCNTNDKYFKFWNFSPEFAAQQGRFLLPAPIPHGSNHKGLPNPPALSFKTHLALSQPVAGLPPFIPYSPRCSPCSCPNGTDLLCSTSLKSPAWTIPRDQSPATAPSCSSGCQEKPCPASQAKGEGK